MHKKWIPCMIAVALVFSTTGVRADETVNTPDTQQVEMTDSTEPREVAPAAETPVASQPREVGPESGEAKKAAKKRKWQNIGIACFAVITAGLGIFLASR